MQKIYLENRNSVTTAAKSWLGLLIIIKKGRERKKLGFPSLGFLFSNVARCIYVPVSGSLCVTLWEWRLREPSMNVGCLYSIAVVITYPFDPGILYLLLALMKFW